MKNGLYEYNKKIIKAYKIYQSKNNSNHQKNNNSSMVPDIMPACMSIPFKAQTNASRMVQIFILLHNWIYTVCSWLKVRQSIRTWSDIIWYHHSVEHNCDPFLSQILQNLYWVLLAETIVLTRSWKVVTGVWQIKEGGGVIMGFLIDWSTQVESYILLL